MLIIAINITDMYFGGCLLMVAIILLMYENKWVNVARVQHYRLRFPQFVSEIYC